jgi:1,2-dihydroxy-3-keto-5-methylthiopentene dioxygenase
MSLLTLYAVEAPAAPIGQAREPEAIEAALAPWSARFERLPLVNLSLDASNDDILAHYASEVAKVKTAYGYVTDDVVRLKRGTPDTGPMRAKFLNEHIHTEDEARFFVEGEGAFYLRNDSLIAQVVCTKGDLILVPAGTRHWFDMGPDPHFTAIRFFTDPAGWVGHFTGDAIADAVPRFDLHHLEQPVLHG